MPARNPSFHVSLTTVLRLCAVSLAITAVVLSTGCASREIPGSTALDSRALQGGVHGGQQPIAGSSVYLFGIHTSTSGATAVTALLPSPATTDVNGAFSLNPSSYSCSDPSDQVFFVSAGGDAGAGSNNSAITLVNLFGTCGNLNNSSFVSINEVTTVAAAFALAPIYGDAYTYATDNVNGFSVAEFTTVWGSLTGPTQLQQLFAAAAALVDSQTGSVATSATSADRETIHALADAAAACVNSTAAGSSPCANLFSSPEWIQQYPPSDTFTALLYVAQNPHYVSGSLVALAPPVAPFQPTLSTEPANWSMPDFYSNVSNLSFIPQ